MLKHSCQKCRRVIPVDDIDAANNLLYCRPCQLTYRLSEITWLADELVAFQPESPPSGVTMQTEDGITLIRAYNRNIELGVALFLGCLFLNCFVFGFAWFTIGAVLYNLHWTVPVCFPSLPIFNGYVSGWPEIIAIWLGLTPLILIGIRLLSGTLNCFFGHTIVALAGNQSSIFTGVKWLGRWRRFDAFQIADVQLFPKCPGETPKSNGIRLVLKSGKEIEFGSTMSKERRSFVLQALRQWLNR